MTKFVHEVDNVQYAKKKKKKKSYDIFIACWAYSESIVGVVYFVKIRYHRTSETEQLIELLIASTSRLTSNPWRPTSVNVQCPINWACFPRFKCNLLSLVMFTAPAPISHLAYKKYLSVSKFYVLYEKLLSHSALQAWHPPTSTITFCRQWLGFVRRR